MLTKIDIDIDDVYDSITHTCDKEEFICEHLGDVETCDIAKYIRDNNLEHDILAEFDDGVILDYVYQNLIDIIRDKIKSESNEE